MAAVLDTRAQAARRPGASADDPSGAYDGHVSFSDAADGFASVSTDGGAIVDLARDGSSEPGRTEPDQTGGKGTGLADPPPGLRAVLRHLGLSLLWANVMPAVLFYVCLLAAGVWAALVAALAWCYGVIGWRLVRRQRTSGLLALTALGVTAKTALAFASGSTFLYFLQPVLSDGLVALMFIASLFTARPVVARLARDFYPMTEELVRRPRVVRLFRRLTLLWALVCLGRALTTWWLLASLPLVTFVALKSTLVLALAAVAVAVTVLAAVRVARSEGLLPPVRTSWA